METEQRRFPEDRMPKPESGLLVAGMGLPGCGKSSVFRELGALIGARAFLEPEEKDWTAAVSRRGDVGHFTGLSWFRAARVPQLFEAEMLRQKGAVALVDSYYDKLLAYYLEAPGMASVMPPEDPYFSVARALARLDLEHLPDADVVVFFEIDEEAWRSFLSGRGRDEDQHGWLLRSFGIQEDMRTAATRYCEAGGRKLLTFRQKRSSPRAAAAELLEALRNAGCRLDRTPSPG